MIRLYTQSHAPHLVIELAGRVSGGEVRTELADLPEVLGALPDRFVVLASYPEVVLFKANAIGPLFYFVTHIFDADPGLCVFVDGGTSPHPDLRAFIQRIGLDKQITFVPTQTEADARIRAFEEQE